MFIVRKKLLASGNRSSEVKMKKLTVILMVLALVLTSVFAQGAAEGTTTTAKKGSVYWLNFKPE